MELSNLVEISRTRSKGYIAKRSTWGRFPTLGKGEVLCMAVFSFKDLPNVCTIFEKWTLNTHP